jgi:hypothetical protein
VRCGLTALEAQEPTGAEPSLFSLVICLSDPNLKQPSRPSNAFGAVAGASDARPAWSANTVSRCEKMITCLRSEERITPLDTFSALLVVAIDDPSSDQTLSLRETTQWNTLIYPICGRAGLSADHSSWRFCNPCSSQSLFSEAGAPKLAALRDPHDPWVDIFTVYTAFRLGRRPANESADTPISEHELV